MSKAAPRTNITTHCCYYGHYYDCYCFRYCYRHRCGYGRYSWRDYFYWCYYRPSMFPVPCFLLILRHFALRLRCYISLHLGVTFSSLTSLCSDLPPPLAFLFFAFLAILHEPPSAPSCGSSLASARAQPSRRTRMSLCGSSQSESDSSSGSCSSPSRRQDPRDAKTIAWVPKSWPGLGAKGMARSPPLRILLPCAGGDAVGRALADMKIPYRVEGAWEIDENAGAFLKELYKSRRDRRNLHIGVEHGDIEMVPAQEVPSADGLVSGPPCPPWSSSGSHLGWEDPRAGPSKTRTIGWAARRTHAPGTPRIVLVGIPEFCARYDALPPGKQAAQRGKWTLLYEDATDVEVANVSDAAKSVARTLPTFMRACVKMRD